MIRKLLALLPTITVGLDDWHLHVSVGERGLGFTVGPHFLSLDDKGDIARQLVSPPENYEAPMCDISFSWDSREGLTYLNVPAYTYKRNPFPWETTDAHMRLQELQDSYTEEPEPSTLRFIRTPTYIDEQRALAGEDVYGGF